MSIQAAMNIGAALYEDAIEELRCLGLPAEFTQTGGMCAALEVRLERGYLLITDVDDSLPWQREELRGWGVGYYASDDVSEGPQDFEETDDTATSALAETVICCLNATAHRHARN